jgi:hypothetical protein
LNKHENWFEKYQSETKYASMQWKHPASPAKKKKKRLRWGHPPAKWCSQSSGITKLLTAYQPQGQPVNADSYWNVLRKLRKAIQRKRPGLSGPGKSPPGSDSRPKNFMLLVFRGVWNDGTSASVYREIILRNKSISQISTLVCLSSVSICNLLIIYKYIYIYKMDVYMYVLAYLSFSECDSFQLFAAEMGKWNSANWNHHHKNFWLFTFLTSGEPISKFGSGSWFV